jgi:hypothetical protein
MPGSLAMSIMSAAEFVLWAALSFMFLKRSLHRRFPAMGVYLALRVAATPLLLALLYLMQAHPQNWDYYAAYVFGYFAVYIASAVLIFFISLEVFRSALSPFPGIAKFGTVIYRWAALVSAVVCLTPMLSANKGFGVIYVHREVAITAAVAFGLMRSVSILELCLLAFLCLCMNALRLPIRDMAFGIAFGFGLMSSGDFIVSSLVSHNTSLTAPLQFVYESLILATLAIWVAYSALPEPARKPVVVPASSRIYRWNEIASALGHTGTQVAVQQPANSFFLTDVEKVVEKVLTKNLKGRESEL